MVCIVERGFHTLLVAAVLQACVAEPAQCTANGGCARPQQDSVLLQTQSTRLQARDRAGDLATAEEDVVVVGSHSQATVGIPIFALEETPSKTLLRLAGSPQIATAVLHAWSAPAALLTELKGRVRLVRHSLYKGEVATESSWADFASLFCGLVLMPLGFYAACAQIYMIKRRVPERVSSKSIDDSFQEWKFPLHGCLDEPDVCLCAFFCPAVRWSETVSFFPALPAFWAAFLVFAVLTLQALSLYPTMWVVSHLLLVCVLTCCRQYMRREFQMGSQGSLTYLTDCVTYLFCCPCAIVQEARQAEEGLRCGHEAVRRPEGRPGFCEA